jgi:thiol-disulfide isomerase/thioredoxin
METNEERWEKTSGGGQCFVFWLVLKLWPAFYTIGMNKLMEEKMNREKKTGFVLVFFFIACFSLWCEVSQKINDELDKVNETYLLKLENINTMYIENSTLILEDGTNIRGNVEIGNFYNKNSIGLKDIEAIKAQARFLSEIGVYEIGNVKTKSGQSFSYLVSWKSSNSVWMRELEILAKKSGDRETPAEITVKRAELCGTVNNDHNVKKLIANLYDASAYYYNKGKLLQGHKAITNEYAYMGDPGYRIALAPDIGTFINTEIVYEIGNWQAGGYRGKYILIWKKQADGNWKILLDSNY